MTKHIKNRIVFSVLLSAGLFSFANAQHDRGRNGGGDRSPRTESSGPRMSTPSSPGMQRENIQRDRPQRTQMERTPQQVRPQQDRGARPTLSQPRMQGNNMNERRGSDNNLQRDNERRGTENDLQRGNERHDFNDRGLRHDNNSSQRNDRNYNNNYSQRGYNNGYRSNNYYQPRRYVYVGAPRYSVIPRGSISIQFGGYPYYYHSGLFYNYYGGFYQPVFPPRGIRISILPFGYYPFYIGPQRYYYSSGFYYKQYDDQNYEVVDAPMGAQVSALPKGTKAAIINGEKFYEFNGTYYKEDRNSKSEVVYTVVGKNGEINNTYDDEAEVHSPVLELGDTVAELPDGSTTVTINDQQLFVAPDGTYLKEEKNEKTTTYKVVGLPTDAPVI